MKKIMVIGSGGAGKSTLARRLGALLHLPVIHLDELYWRPNWVETPKPEWTRQVESLVQEERWVIDGNYSGTMAIRLAACDTVVFLDLPRHVCLGRVIKRLLIYRRRNRPDMAAGCPEHLNLTFLLWIWNFPKVTRPKIDARLAEFAAQKRVVRLTGLAEVEAFLAGLRPE
jgi:adenylate kinase family enzyme